MEDVYDDFGRQPYRLKLIQYYALYDPNCELGLIQGLRYYPRNGNTVIPNNPKLKTSINYYKPYTNPRVVLPKPRYKKKLSSVNKEKINDKNKNNINTLNQYNNYENNNEGINTLNRNNNEIYQTYRRAYSNEKEANLQ